MPNLKLAKTLLLLFIASAVMTASSSSSSKKSSGSSSKSKSSGSSSSSGSSGKGGKLKFHGKYVKIADILKGINSVRKTPAKWAEKIDKEYIKNMDKDKVTHKKWKRKFKEGLPAM
jgi:LysM repeat protein